MQLFISARRIIYTVTESVIFGLYIVAVLHQCHVHICQYTKHAAQSVDTCVYVYTKCHIRAIRSRFVANKPKVKYKFRWDAMLFFTFNKNTVKEL
jgi:hypothetical protein